MGCYSMGFVGRKAGMSRVFLEDGCSIPVTLIEATANRVVQIKLPMLTAMMLFR